VPAPYLAINDRLTTRGSYELPGISQKTIVGLTLLGSFRAAPLGSERRGRAVKVLRFFKVPISQTRRDLRRQWDLPDPSTRPETQSD
jgi:hypothetical protein